MNGLAATQVFEEVAYSSGFSATADKLDMSRACCSTPPAA